MGVGGLIDSTRQWDLWHPDHCQLTPKKHLNNTVDSWTTADNRAKVSGVVQESTVSYHVNEVLFRCILGVSWQWSGCHRSHWRVEPIRPPTPIFSHLTHTYLLCNLGIRVSILYYTCYFPHNGSSLGIIVMVMHWNGMRLKLIYRDTFGKKEVFRNNSIKVQYWIAKCSLNPYKLAQMWEMGENLGDGGIPLIVWGI